MPFTLEQVVPWGRSFDEYRRIFALTEMDLAKPILGCADGPASFNAEMTQLGHHVISADPLYAFSGEQISSRIAQTSPTIKAQCLQNLDDYVWHDFADPEALCQYRLAVMDRFLADYDHCLAQGRYLVQMLPHLEFADDAFGLALCSHFLFLYSQQFDADFHGAAALELCRVAREVRIFPLLALDCRPSPHIGTVQEVLTTAGYQVEIVQVDHEFQRGGNKMMKIRGC